MIHWIFVLAALFIASISDIKSKEVPDFLSYMFIISGLAFGAFMSLDSFSYTPFLYSILGFFATFLFSMALYYTGQWGGGDAKLFMGMGAWLGLPLTQIPEIVIFLGNLMLVGGAYGLLWSLYLLIRHFKKFSIEYKKLIKTHIKLRIVGAILAVTLSIFLFFFLQDLLYKLVFSIMPLFLFLFSYVWVGAKAVELACFYKMLPVSKLVEGDWIVKPIKINNKEIVKPKDIGATKEQIRLLKKHEVKSVLVKEGIPFVPPFFIAAIVTIIFKNWFMAFF